MLEVKGSGVRPVDSDAAMLRVIDGGHMGGAGAYPPRIDHAGLGGGGLTAAAREEVRRRSDRRLVLGPDMLADPAWDMLLDLYLARAAGRRVAVSSLCVAAGVPTTTALRWIRFLEHHGLMVRERDREDGRRSFVDLSPGGREKIELLLRRALDRGTGR